MQTTSLAAFFEQVSPVADADAIPHSGRGFVTLMTLHAAMGLEFPVVSSPGWRRHLPAPAHGLILRYAPVEKLSMVIPAQ